MSAAWAVVLVTGLATVLLKGLGPLVLGGRRLPAAADGVLALLAPTLLAALVATQTFATGRHLVLDARAAGVAAGMVAVALRAPVLAVVVAAAATAALIRALGG
jgi:branched-subunit amino acid transport protein